MQRISFKVLRRLLHQAMPTRLIYVALTMPSKKRETSLKLFLDGLQLQRGTLLGAILGQTVRETRLIFLRNFYLQTHLQCRKIPFKMP